MPNYGVYVTFWICLLCLSSQTSVLLAAPDEETTQDILRDHIKDNLDKSVSACQKECQSQSMHEIWNTTCVSFRKVRPFPRMIHECEKVSRQSLKAICPEVCREHLTSSSTSGTEVCKTLFPQKKNQQLKKNICRKYESMLPRPNMRNLCHDSFTKTLSVGCTRALFSAGRVLEGVHKKLVENGKIPQEPIPEAIEDPASDIEGSRLRGG